MLQKPFSQYWPFVRGIHGHRWIPSQRASDTEFWFVVFVVAAVVVVVVATAAAADVVVVLRMIERFDKQSICRWFEMPCYPYAATVMKRYILRESYTEYAQIFDQGQGQATSV